MPATVSVIMNCWNGERYLREAIDSVFEQTFTDWEIIFWDNASTDKSADIAKSYGKKVRYFRSNEKTSLGEARDRAFKKAKGDFIALLDVDDIWMPKKLEAQLKMFDDQDVALTFTNATSFDSTGEHSNAFDIVTPARGKVFPKLLSNNFIWSVTMIFRSSALSKMEYLFNGKYTIICDFDLSLRIANLYKVDYSDECLAKWRMSPEDSAMGKSFLAALECQGMIKDLETSFPEVLQKYSKEFSNFKATGDRKLAEETWIKGDIKTTRSLLYKHKTESIIYYFFYYATWIYPFKVPVIAIKFIRLLKKKMRKTICR